MNMTSTQQDIIQWLASARVFFGDLSTAEARVYVELDRCEAMADLTLAGRVIGPVSEYSRTLKTTVPLGELPAGETRLCSALMPDPCFWTPLLPFVYTVRLVAFRAGVEVAACEQMFGLRPLGIRGGDLFLDGKRIVLRAVDRRLVEESSIVAYRESCTSLLVKNPEVNLLEECTRHGVLVCAELAGTEAEMIARLQALGRHPCAGIVLTAAEACTDNLVAARPRNVLLAAMMKSDAALPTGADLVAIEADSSDAFPVAFIRKACPILAIENQTQTGAVAELRTECDRLQAALAGRGRLAGYLIREKV